MAKENEKAAATLGKHIQVKSTGTDNKIVIFERDERHPDGQAVVANDGRVETVAETPGILRKIADGALVKV